MDRDKYIEVAVALPVHNTFTYKIPEHMENIELAGMRVLVPFGRRRVTGYVLGYRSEGGNYQPKLVLDLLDDIPLFSISMVPFFRWISGYYIHPLGEVIKTALPVGLDSHDVSHVSLSDRGRELLESGDLSPGEHYVASLLESVPSISLRALTSGKFEKKESISVGFSGGGPGTPINHYLVRKMCSEGLLELSSELKKDKNRIRMDKFISISDSANFSDDGLKLSLKRKTILDLLAKRKELSLSALRKEVPTAPRLINHMAEAGFLNITERQLFRDPFGDTVDPDIPPSLNTEQEEVVNRVVSKMDSGFQRYLLCGVTGSGKTEVYMRLVTESVNRGRGAIILVPEISLISQTERRFRARFGNSVAIIHSGLSKGELLDQWYRIATGAVSIVIGARSAIFAPVKDPGIIIVDEEHDTSYKQESGLRYNARDLAVVRAQQHKSAVVLGSATPSIQSYYNASQGRFEALFLKKRVNSNPLPEITLVDLKKYRDGRGVDRLITPELAKEIAGCLRRGEQVLIFLNRRGFASYPVCDACGDAVRCNFCDITMTLHRSSGEFRCHLCGFSSPVEIKDRSVPQSRSHYYGRGSMSEVRTSSDMKCRKCGSLKIKPLGFGTEKVENLLKSMFRDARIIRLDQDTGSAKGATVQILKKVKNRTVDIIVGTQMLAKGHDFPAITLVGVICADLSLNFPDFRAGERTFQLLAQVAGRAGRGDKPGKVIMQTYTPDHFSIEASRDQDFLRFYNSEIPFRKALSYPPFSRIVQLKISGTDMESVKEHAIMVGELCRELIDKGSITGAATGAAGNGGTADCVTQGNVIAGGAEKKVANRESEIENGVDPVEMLGPVEAGIPKISMRYRWQILLKSPSAAALNRMVRLLMSDRRATAKDISVAVDVDPYFMM